MRHLLSALTGGLLSVFTLCGTAQATYSASYIFGDSLADTGNFNILTNGVVPGGLLQAPYSNGRFSNGPVYTEIVSASLGLSAIPSFAGGTNYAVGGARTDGHTIPQLTPFASLQAQYSFFSQSHGGVADSNALYTMNIGSNDVFDAIDSFGQVYLATGDANLAVAVASSIIANATSIIDATLQALVNAGARTIIIPTVTNLGLTPAVPNDAKTVATALTMGFNSIIDQSILALTSANSSLRIVRPDTFSLLSDAVANPAKYGFSNVSDPCYSGFVGQQQLGDTVCANPDEYLFWDIMHPTAVGHQMLAANVMAALPEPQGMVLLLIGLAALLLARRRRT